MSRANPRSVAMGALLRAGHGPTTALVERALAESQGHVRAASRALGVAERTMWQWLVDIPAVAALRYTARGRAESSPPQVG